MPLCPSIQSVRAHIVSVRGVERRSDQRIPSRIFFASGGSRLRGFGAGATDALLDATALVLAIDCSDGCAVNGGREKACILAGGAGGGAAILKWVIGEKRDGFGGDGQMALSSV